MNNQKKANLKRNLRRAVEEAENEFSLSLPSPSSSYCRKLLDAFDLFLTSWDDLVTENDEIEKDNIIDNNDSMTLDDLPRELIRRIMCNVIQFLGVGHEDLRAQMLTTLQSVESFQCREVVLEVLPAILPRKGDKIITSRFATSQDDVNDEIFSSLKGVFEGDRSLLRPIIHSLDVMTKSEKIDVYDAFQFIMEILSKVPETYLHIAIEALIEYSNKELGEADETKHLHCVRDAVDEVRTELFLLDTTGISDMFDIIVVFFEAVQSEKNLIFLERYLERCEEIAVTRNTTPNRSPKSGEKEAETHLSTFDFAMLLILAHKESYRGRIKTMLERVVYAQSGLLREFQISNFVELIQQEDSEENNPLSIESDLSCRLFLSLIDISISLLFVEHPPRKEFETVTPHSEIRSFIVQVILALPEKFQRKMISKMIKFAETIMMDVGQSTSKKTYERDLVNSNESQLFKCRDLYDILVTVSESKYTTLLPFLSNFVDELKSNDMNFYLDESIQQMICSLVVTLHGNVNKSMSTEQLLVCRSLFSSIGGACCCSSIDETMKQRRLRGLRLLKLILLKE